jgi:hypothetical protein
MGVLAAQRSVAIVPARLLDIVLVSSAWVVFYTTHQAAKNGLTRPNDSTTASKSSTYLSDSNPSLVSGFSERPWALVSYLTYVHISQDKNASLNRE